MNDRLNVPPPPQRQRKAPRRLSEEERQDIAARYRVGWTCQQLADEYGCTDMAVWQALHRLGVEMRGRGKRLT